MFPKVNPELNDAYSFLSSESLIKIEGEIKFKIEKSCKRYLDQNYLCALFLVKPSLSSGINVAV
jgi:hypothetical protein